MKTIITAFIIALTLTTSVAAEHRTAAECQSTGDAIEQLAILRDKGIHPSEIYDRMTGMGFSENLIVGMLNLVFIDGKGVTGKVLNETLVARCMGVPG